MASPLSLFVDKDGQSRADGMTCYQGVPPAPSSQHGILARMPGTSRKQVGWEKGWGAEGIFCALSRGAEGGDRMVVKT